MKDNAGDENFRLYGVNVATGEQKDYTPFDKVRVRMLGLRVMRLRVLRLRVLSVRLRHRRRLTVALHGRR